MRQIVKLMAVTIVCIVMGACSNDDVNPVQNDAKAVITLNTAALYEQLNTTSEMNAFLADSKNYVYATVLIYDQQGSLVKQSTKKAQSLQPLEYQLEGIDDGTYTLVAFQTAAGEETVWSLTDVEKLSGVRVAIPDRTLLPAEVALGTASQTITISNGTCKAEVSAKSVGSIIETQAVNYTAADEVKALSMTYFADIRGVYLDPSRTGTDRLDIVSDNLHRFDQVGDKETILEGNIKWKGFALYTGEQIKLDLAKYIPEEGLFYTFAPAVLDMKPGGNYVFYYDNDPQQLYKLYAGTHEGLAEWLAKRNADPYATKPCMAFGSTMDDMIAFMKTNYGWWINDMPDKQTELDDMLGLWKITFSNGNAVIRYHFETQDGQKMVMSNFDYMDTKISVDVMKAQLVKEGYNYKGYLKSPWYTDIINYVYMPDDESLEIQITDWGNGKWSIGYQLPDPNDLKNLITE